MSATATPRGSRIRAAGPVIAVMILAGIASAQPKSLPGLPQLPPKAPEAVPPPVEDDRPRVAVINLQDSSDSQQLANAIENALNRRAELAPVDRLVAAALVGAETEEDRAINLARAKLAEARDYMGKFELPRASDRADEGLVAMTKTTPSPATTGLIADLVFARGEVEFRAGQAATAKAFFAWVHRLAPGRALDPAVHAPELIRAFAAAAALPPDRNRTIKVQTSGTIWLDGQIQGKGPRELNVAPGWHMIIMSDPDLTPDGQKLDLRDKEKVIVTLDPKPVRPEVLAARARRALMAAPDATARASAMNVIKRIAGMSAAVLVTNIGVGDVSIQLWRDRMPGFGQIQTMPRPLSEEKADDIIAPLVPKKKAQPPPPDDRIGRTFPIPEPPKPWWKRRWVQVTAGTALLGAIVGGILISRAGADFQHAGEHGFDSPDNGRR